MKKKYETLQHFIAGYFHQDWDLEGGSDVEIARQFAINDPVTAKFIVAEIDELVENSRENPEVIDLILDNYGCEYRYKLDFPSGGKWLIHINSIIKDSI